MLEVFKLGRSFRDKGIKPQITNLKFSDFQTHHPSVSPLNGRAFAQCQLPSSVFRLPTPISNL